MACSHRALALALALVLALDLQWGFPMLNDSIYRVLALAAMLALQSEWVLYPF